MSSGPPSDIPAKQVLQFRAFDLHCGMTETERAILKQLTDLDDAVARMPTAQPKPNLLPIFEELDRLTLALPPGSDPELLHFLHRKSYEKARVLLRTKV